MKAFLGEYARIVAASIVLLILIGFFFSAEFLGIFPKPVATKKNDDMETTVDSIAQREEPVFVQGMKYLVEGTTYNLEDKTQMHITATSADGNALPVKVTKIVFNDSEVDLAYVSVYQAQRGVTEVTYEITDPYKGADLVSEKTVRYVCD